MTRTDVCIVGAGAAGMTLAHALRDSGLSVLVVESGPNAQELNEGEVAGLPYNGLVSGRRRGLGGTTALWPGQCARMRPEDLARWPIELTPWYEQAERLFRLVPGETERDPWELFGERDPGFDPARIASTTSAFARHRNLGKLEPATTGTTVTAVADGRVETPAGEIEADAVVICAGGLESTRLLLASGFRHEALGRRFLDHAACRPARVVGDARTFQDRYGMRFTRGRRYRPRLLLAREAMEHEGVPGCAGNIVFDYGPDSAFHAALRLKHGRPALGDLKHAPHFLRAAARVARGRDPALPTDAIRVLTVIEPVARDESRLTLGDERDPLGVPRLRVDWRLGEEERRAAELLVTTLDDELRRTGAGALAIEDWVTSDDWREHMFDVFHPAGATRMGDDGVVDADCRVHGTRGVYVCSSSVFPVLGCAPPTLTIVALAFRLADHLRRA